jgi:diguanylate cyclase (GGDEF)-like protein/PAS domain S-box-containing protein
MVGPGPRFPSSEPPSWVRNLDWAGRTLARMLLRLRARPAGIRPAGGQRVAHGPGDPADPGNPADPGADPGNLSGPGGPGADPDRARSLEAVFEERTRLAEIVEHISDGIAALEPDGTVSCWNAGFQRITGYRAEDLVGTRGLARLRPRDLAGREVRLERWAEEAELPPSVLEVLTPSGGRCWISCSYARVPARDGSPRRLVLTSRDVTKERELERAEQALRRSAARFRALVQNSSHMVVVVDAGGGVTYASPAYWRMLGHRDQAQVGQSLFDLVHPHDLPTLRGRFAEHLAGEARNASFEFRCLAADGTWRHLEALASNLLDDPAVAGVVLNTRDLTDRKHAEGLLAAQAQVLGLIARDAPLMETLSALARLIEAESDGARCAVLLLDDEGDALTVAAAPSLVDAGLHEADGLVVGPEGGSSGTAVHRHAPVLVADVASDPLWAETRQAALARGLRAAWAMPIMTAESSQVLGTVTVYFDRPRGAAPNDVRLLEAAADLADIAIERSRAQAQLAHQAAHDALTGLPNRVFFLDRAAHALDRTRRSHSSVAVLFCDLDRFKVINDSLGHEAGDTLLRQLAGRLQEVVRPGDTVARFGGDEFTILCESIADESHALAIAERVGRVAATPFALGDGEVFVTMSVGIALGSGTRTRPEALIENADAAMYRAKARGGNRREVFDRDMRARAKRRLALHSALHRAVERGEFRVLYQPVVSLQSLLPVGAEALVRWQHPERGLVGPREFIGLAEETGLIVPIGTRVLHEACREAERWRAAEPGRVPPCIKVNLSARQFAHPNLVEVVAGILAETGVDPASVYLEITETVLMEDAESTSAALRELKSLGVSLTVDDFGTGYSSLLYLKRFPVDELKVDRTFVAGLLGNAEDEAIVAAIVSLAHTLGLKAVAEGVESPAQLTRLRELGCDLGQGYHFARPMPADSMAPHLGLQSSSA